MKKEHRKVRLLILSYHYLPMNVIASYRPKGFADHLYKYGIYPTILTHFWEKDDKNKFIQFHNLDKTPIVETYETHRVIRIPKIKTKLGRFVSTLEKKSFLRKSIIILSWLCGYLDTTSDQLDSFFCFRKFIFKHLRQNKYDIVMGIYSPHHHLKLCYEVGKKFNIPYVLDFRDLWNNMATSKDYKAEGETRIKEFFVKKYWAKWLSRASFFTTISDEWVKKIAELTTTQGYRIMHGYDDDIAAMQDADPASQTFTVLYSGSLYQNQDLDGFLEGVRIFINEKEPNNFQLLFLGSYKKVGSLNSKLIDNLDCLISTYVDKRYYKITRRVPRKEVIEYYKQATILLSLTYKSMQGTYAGKLFEYLGTRKPILVYPDDQSVIKDLVVRTNTGLVADSPEEVYLCLKSLYNRWLEGYKELTEPNLEELKLYSREHQVKKLANTIFNKTGNI